MTVTTKDVAERVAAADLPPWVAAVGAAPMTDADGQAAFAIYLLVAPGKTDFDGNELARVRRNVRMALSDVPAWPYVRVIDNRDVMISGAEVVRPQAA